MEKLSETFKDLFECLHGVGYAWEPQAPDSLLRLRSKPELFSPLTRYFGLGLPVSALDLMNEGVDQALIEQISSLRPAVSSCGNFFIPHHHWPANPERPDLYIYYGKESLSLARQIQPHLEKFVGKRILDLGCGAGALAFEIASLAQEVLGLDCSTEAIQWARAAAEAQGISNVRFEEMKVGLPRTDAWMELRGIRYDLCLFNPPMTIPKPGSIHPHRDGGRLGIEIPCLFLSFAYRFLEPGGKVFCLVSSPKIQGRSLFFDELDRSKWKILEMNCLNHHFNQSLSREDRYGTLGIERIELWFLLLQKDSIR